MLVLTLSILSGVNCSLRVAFLGLLLYALITRNFLSRGNAAQEWPAPIAHLSLQTTQQAVLFSNIRLQRLLSDPAHPSDHHSTGVVVHIIIYRKRATSIFDDAVNFLVNFFGRATILACGKQNRFTRLVRCVRRVYLDERVPTAARVHHTERFS